MGADVTCRAVQGVGADVACPDDVIVDWVLKPTYLFCFLFTNLPVY